MSELKNISCKCGRNYVTKHFASKCPACGKTNWTAEGGLAIIIFIVALAIFIGLLIGSVFWSFTARRKKLNQWHSIGSIALSVLAFYIFIDMYNEYPNVSIIAFILNGGGIILAASNLSELYKKKKNIKEHPPSP